MIFAKACEIFIEEVCYINNINYMIRKILESKLLIHYFLLNLKINK